jgi:superfamily I DNA/RNA helicase
MGFEFVSGPPASGKKSYLKEKISQLINSGINPEQLLILTNSRNSARFFRESILEEINSFSELWIETVTSLCKKLLRENYYYTPLKPGFKVITDFEKRLVVRNILRRKIDFKFLASSPYREGLIREISNFIDIAKRNPKWEENIKLAEDEKKLKYNDLKLIFTLYQKTMEKFNYLDFVDLAIHARDLVKTCPRIMNFEAIFVYEAEDMDSIMGDIIEEILKRAAYGFVSLSDESGIYDFRGSNPAHIRDKLINNFNFREQQLTQETTPLKEFFLEAETRDEQAQLVAFHIASKIKSGINPGDIAIISRSIGENLWIFTEALRRRGINHLLIGGIGFFRQAEIIELMSLLTCINQKQETDDSHIYRTLKLLRIFDENQLDIIRIKSSISGKSLKAVFSRDIPEKWNEFWNCIEELSKTAQELPVDRLIYELMDKYDFFARALNHESACSVYRYFYQIVRNFSEHYLKLNTAPLKLNQFMENIFELMSAFGKELDIPLMPEQEAVKIMTVQQAKPYSRQKANYSALPTLLT